MTDARNGADKRGNLKSALGLIKPDGVQQGLAGEIIARFERSRLTIRALKVLDATRPQAEQHYTEEDL